MKLLYSVTPAKAAALRAQLAACGVKGARVRQMPNGAARLVLASPTDRDNARDALILADACTACGDSFTSPNSQHAWNGPVEIFVRFLAA